MQLWLSHADRGCVSWLKWFPWLHKARNPFKANWSQLQWTRDQLQSKLLTQYKLMMNVFHRCVAQGWGDAADMSILWKLRYTCSLATTCTKEKNVIHHFLCSFSNIWEHSITMPVRVYSIVESAWFKRGKWHPRSFCCLEGRRSLTD